MPLEQAMVFILSVFGQVEDYAPFIDTLDYVFHTRGITAVEVTQFPLPQTYISCPTVEQCVHGVFHSNSWCRWLATTYRYPMGLTSVHFPCRYTCPETRSTQGDTQARWSASALCSEIVPAKVYRQTCSLRSGLGVDGGRSFADDTTAVRPRGCRWGSGAEGRQWGILTQG